MNSVKALAYQIKNGKNGMPGFGDRLQTNEIEEIGTYLYTEVFEK